MRVVDFIIRKRILYPLFIFSLFFILWLLNSYDFINKDVIIQYRENNPLYALFLFFLLYILSIILLLPTLPLNLFAGFLWGGLLGGIFVALSVTCGGWIAFNISRSAIGPTLRKKFFNTYIQSLLVNSDLFGWKLVAFARLNPLIPSAPLNYLLGITLVSNKTFVITTFFFILPPSLLVSLAGETLGSMVLSSNDISNLYVDLLYLTLLSIIFLLINYCFYLYKKKFLK